MSFIRPSPPVTDPKIIADIRHELAFGTPNTPERIATMKRADAAYERSFVRPQFRTKLIDWVASVPHKKVEAAWGATMGEFMLPIDWPLGKMHPGHLLFFIERLAEMTL